MKSLTIAILAVSVICLHAVDVLAGLMKINLGSDLVTVQINQESGDTQLLFENPVQLNLQGIQIESVYLYLSLSAQRNSNSEHLGELLCLGAAPLTLNGDLDDTLFKAEYTLLPGDNSTVVWDITGLFRAWYGDTITDHGFGVYSCDENDEAYTISVSEDQADIGWIEIRYIGLR